MLSFGAVIPGREALAVACFTELSRFFGSVLDDGVSSFAPYFFADGLMGDVSGFFLVQGSRDRLDRLRREDEFGALLLRAGAATQNVRIHTLIAGSEAGRLVNRYRDVRMSLGLIQP
jgi:hypothetical protein